MVKQIADLELLKSLCSQKKTPAEIMELTGWSKSTVQKWSRRLGFPPVSHIGQHVPSKREIDEEAKIKRYRELCVERGWV